MEKGGEEMKIVQIAASQTCDSDDSLYESVFALTDDGEIYECTYNTVDRAWIWDSAPLPKLNAKKEDDK